MPKLRKGRMGQDRRGEVETFPQVEITKAEYSAIYSEQRGTRPSICGEFRFRICPASCVSGSHEQSGWVTVFMTDSKEHNAPESVLAFGDAA